MVAFNTVLGTPGNDTLDYSNGITDDADSVRGYAGDDIIFAGGGNDTVIGSAGKDSIYGEDGDDNLQGGADDDQIEGGIGLDSITGGEGNDNILGGEGNDTLYGNSGDDNLQGDGGDDLAFGGAGNDLFNASKGVDTLDGGSGFDTVFFDRATTAVQVDLSGSRPNLGDEAAGDVYISIEGIFGSEHNDSLYGSNGVNTIQGNKGNDRIEARAGDDVLFGDDGNDVLIGGKGLDLLFGGAGADQFRVQGVSEINGDNIYDFEVGVDKLVLTKAFGTGTIVDGVNFFTDMTSLPTDSAYLLYDQSFGSLVLDLDGTNGAEPELGIFFLHNNVDLSASDFLVF